MKKINKKTITVRMSPKNIDIIDNYCLEHGLVKGCFMERATLEKIEREQKKEEK